LVENPGSTAVEATPLWFGPDDRPLFGWLHTPVGGVVRGGVVLCQPLGIEAICTYFSYRLLAEELAGRGLAVLRFDYDGTGDSAGNETDPDRLDAWLDSVSAATDFLLDAGVPRCGLLGIRMGGLFAAAEACRRGGVDALVLWDTCLSGRSFLREQRFLRLLSGTGHDQVAEADGEPGDEAVEAPGLRIEPETVKALSDLDLGRMAGTLATRTLVLTPPGSSRPRRLERRLEGTEVDWQEATGQSDLLDSALQATPFETIGRAADWLSGALEGEPVTMVLPTVATTAVVERPTDGGPIVERPVDLGPLRLFGIVTEPADGPTGPTIVLVNEGNTHHIGQARIWVDLARTLAASGLRVLRFDLSGNGDSRTRPGQTAHVARAPEAIDDVYEAMAAIAPDHPTDVVLVGFCSGAYQVIEQALAHPPRGICVINPTFSFAPPEPAGTALRPARQVTRRWVMRAVAPALRWLGRGRDPADPERWVTALEVGTWPESIATRHPGIPSAVWWAVNHALLANTGVATLEQILDSGVDTMLVCGPGDLHPITLGSEGRMRRLERAPRFTLARLDELDHASWARHQRETLIAVVDAHLTTSSAWLDGARDRGAVGVGPPV
jgi:alpha-beta hydrolase superfamily lysophospholipase